MRKSIMLVDDDRTSNFVNSFCLKNSAPDADVIEFVNPLKALEFLKESGENAPDYILLDVNMPEMNGWDFLEEYENNGWDEDFKTEVIILTSSNNVRDVEYAEKFPVVKNYIQKPFTKEDLAVKLPNLLESPFEI